MLRDQMLNFLASAIVFLLLTNAASAIVALYAMRLANALRPVEQHAAAPGWLDAFLRRSA
jgi:hypothetical protein